MFSVTSVISYHHCALQKRAQSTRKQLCWNDIQQSQTIQQSGRVGLELSDYWIDTLPSPSSYHIIIYIREKRVPVKKCLPPIFLNTKMKFYLLEGHDIYVSRGTVLKYILLCKIACNDVKKYSKLKWRNLFSHYSRQHHQLVTPASLYPYYFPTPRRGILWPSLVRVCSFIVMTLEEIKTQNSMKNLRILE